MKFFQSKAKKENKILRDLLTKTWRLMDRATLVFGYENNLEYYEAWERYRELEKKCEPFLNKWFENGPDNATMSQDHKEPF